MYPETPPYTDSKYFPPQNGLVVVEGLRDTFASSEGRWEVGIRREGGRGGGRGGVEREGGVGGRGGLEEGMRDGGRARLGR